MYDGARVGRVRSFRLDCSYGRQQDRPMHAESGGHGSCQLHKAKSAVGFSDTLSLHGHTPVWKIYRYTYQSFYRYTAVVSICKGRELMLSVASSAPRAEPSPKSFPQPQTHAIYTPFSIFVSHCSSNPACRSQAGSGLSGLPSGELMAPLYHPLLMLFSPQLRSYGLKVAAQ